MNPLSPEALVVAANASTAAQQMAMMAAIFSGITVILCLIIGAIVIWNIIKFDTLVVHTNSIMDRLVKTTHIEAMARGDREGREEQLKEQAMAAVERTDATAIGNLEGRAEQLAEQGVIAARKTERRKK